MEKEYKRWIRGNSMLAFWMAVLGALCWGIAPAFGKIGLRGVQPLDGLVARTMITVLFVGTFALANGSLGRLSSISLKGWGFLAMEAFLATFAGDLAYYAALKWGAISQTAVILAVSPLVTIWMGHTFMGENMSPVNILGAVLIIAGLVMVGINNSL